MTEVLGRPGAGPVSGSPTPSAVEVGGEVGGGSAVEVGGFVAVCRYVDLLPERGVAALVGGRQVAVFRCHDGRVRAVGQRDPFSGANIMSRGIVGTRGDRVTVAAPMFKQVFDLDTGRCLDAPDDDTVALPVHPVTVGDDGVVRVGVRPVDGAAGSAGEGGRSG